MIVDRSLSIFHHRQGPTSLRVHESGTPKGLWGRSCANRIDPVTLESLQLFLETFSVNRRGWRGLGRRMPLGWARDRVYGERAEHSSNTITTEIRIESPGPLFARDAKLSTQ
ncbi:hypothetical protein TNCV_2859971 [Trichonephila clavipes]|nr:hypothetical protein TNCV_2859971 [Trichonephila clavipes]